MKRSIDRAKKDISHHYDIGNNFYRLFLGEHMVYSCAYFKDGREDIDGAQRNKLDYICRKLRLKPGEKFLDIGCGWGGLIIWAAKHFGVEALGVTLSRNQQEHAQDWIEREGIARHCRVELRDYREIAGEAVFDKIASIGMFEHVGIRNLPIYFKAVKRILKEKGLFLNHGITEEKKDRGKSSGTKFINTYVFPGGELTNISQVLSEMEKVGFEILDVESLRPHYAKTLRLWTLNLRNRKAAAVKLVGERTYRIWELYMAACSFGFEKGNINIYQTLVSKHSEPGAPKVPLTRSDLYGTADNFI